MRVRRRWLLVALLAVLAIVAASIGAGSAAADDEPAAGQGTSVQNDGGKKLPAGFPTPLKRFVAGTEEFKSAPWFKGVCADKGGDFAGYLAAMFPVEPELLFWSRSEDERAAQLADRYKENGSLSPKISSAEEAKKAMSGGSFRPTRDNGWLDASYPTDKSEDYPSTTPVCAEDLAQWGNKSISAWGFEFVDVPDDDSIKAMAGGDAQLENRIRKPCESPSAEGVWFCVHAFYLDCEKPTEQREITKCRQWNVGVGKLFRGTANWIDQNTGVSDRINNVGRNAIGLWLKTTPAYWQGKIYSAAFANLWNQTAGAVAKFFKDAQDMPEKWANWFKEFALDLTTTVLPGLASVGEFDLKAPWFLKWYAMSIGLGFAVMTVMFLLATVRASRSGGAEALARDTLGYLPTAIAAMMYTPMLAWMLQALAHEMTMLIANLMGTSMDEVVDNVSSMLGSLTNETLVGGVIGAIIGFGLLGMGAFALFLGLLMHQIGIPLACVACAIGYGMLVHPTWRRKALRVPMMLISLILSTPLLFLALAVIIQVINWSAAESTTGDGKLASWGQLALCAFAFFVIGIAPFSLLKWSPLLPGNEDADRMGDSGGGAGQIVGAGGMGAAGGVRASHSARETSGAASGSGAHHAAAASHHGGGAHAAGGGGGGGGGGSGQVVGKAGKAMSMAGGPVTATAGRLASVAGKGAHVAGDAAKAGVSAGTRAGAINASQRAHGIAADSAPTTSN